MPQPQSEVGRPEAIRRLVDIGVEGKKMMGDPLIERVAQALCPHAGQNPDDVGSGSIFVVNAPSFSVSPRWHEYADKAREFLVMCDAIKPL
jgi:hypothetical protein